RPMESLAEYPTAPPILPFTTRIREGNREGERRIDNVEERRRSSPANRIYGCENGCSYCGLKQRLVFEPLRRI
ncbi:hypothetical protein PRIPAC_75030, partial [Pristionchus pacificus]|uniref:Uncharacterized protein n=1 Tax=Pristionchus pacificus TaxID=54126 RepID=A0A2A6CAJ3_PRIPA